MNTSIRTIGFLCLINACRMLALPPAPPNDDPLNAEVLDPTVPTVVFGTTVLANDSISTTPLPAPVNDVDGPDVFYDFTPANTEDYRFTLLPWQRAPLRSSDRRFILYVLDDDGFAIAGAEAPGNARPFSVEVNLMAGTAYRIGVDYDAATHDNFPFTLIVDTVPATIPDDCATTEVLSTDLPTAVSNSIDGGTADYLFEQGTGTCAVSGGSPTDAAGIEHVYRFTPDLTGEYAFELAVNGFDGVLYINTSCPPVFPGGCLGASNHTTGGTSGGKHELIVATLQAATDYYIYVDTAGADQLTGEYTLIADTALAYEISEVEPNDTPGTASSPITPLNGGQLVGPGDEDWWAISGGTGDRVYAWANNGGTSNSTLDADMAFIAADGSSLIEFDDEDADGADAPIEDLRFIYSTSSPVIAGAQLTSNGTHYLQVTKQNATGTIHRYRMHIGVEPANRNPLLECEPNDTLAGADRTGKDYFRGVIDTDEDVDVFAFEAVAGDRVFLALDGDPERDANGFMSPIDDPLAFSSRLAVFDPAGDLLIEDISDSNSIQSGPDFPAQGGFFVARSSGLHYVSVDAQSSSGFGPNKTYELAIFKNAAAPSLAEVVDPVVDVTPDFISNLIAVSASDSAPGDSGICDVSLIDATNVELTGVSFTPGDPSVNFTVTLTNGTMNGRGKLIVTDCEGNSSCALAKIDVNPPMCDGFNFSTLVRTAPDEPIPVPDNQPGGPGIESTIDVPASGLVTDVNVTVTIETIRPLDIDCFLISPLGTTVELFTDRGSPLEFDITEATFDDDAEELLPLLSSEAPYTGTWLPEDPAGLAQLNGEDAMGMWRLRVIDDSSSANGGARLVEWELEIDAAFPGPDTFAGTATDVAGFDCGIASVDISGVTNATLSVDPAFVPGDQSVAYSVTLDNPSMNGSATITVTDLAENVCMSVVNLSGLPDATMPVNNGGARTFRSYKAEVQAPVPGGDIEGFTSTLNVPDSGLVGEVEVDLTIDTKDVGRLASTLTHEDRLAVLINRVGMDERGSVGLTKDIIDITLDDDAPQEDDAHEEPPLGSEPFQGLHQPDGRGRFVGDGITTDDRDNMLFDMHGVDSFGQWRLFTGDFREQGASAAQSVFRRWNIRLKNPCGAEHYAGVAEDLAPGTGICTIELAPGATNVSVFADFLAGDNEVPYEVVLIDESLAGWGTLEITDCANNVTSVPINLAAASGDVSLPQWTGMFNPTTVEFEATVTDMAAGDTGIETVELAPYSTNLQLIDVTPFPPSGAGTVDILVGLEDPLQNGRGYVRATDGCGLQSVIQIAIDAAEPICTGATENTRWYPSPMIALPIPDNSGAGVNSSIVVPDTDIVSDLNVTLNITHPLDDDLTVQLIANPTVIPLFSEIGSTGNDFIDTTIDDEAAMPIPDSSAAAPFTGSFQPEGGPALFVVDGSPADGLYQLRVFDDTAFNTGTLDSWSLTIESPTFPPRYAGRAEDSESLGTGICNIELLPDAVNLTLTTEAYSPGSRIVRYSVDVDCFANDGEGSGTVRISDCAGNSCDVPVALQCELCPATDSPAATGTGACSVDGDCTNTAVCRNNICYAPKTRYLTLAPGNGGESVALRVTHVGSGRQWWIGEPNAGNIAPLVDNLAPKLYRDWAATPNISVTGCGIAPEGEYLVQAIHEECDPGDEDSYSDTLSLPTVTTWGDTVGDFVAGAWTPPNETANFVDILATVQGFQSVPTAAPLEWLDVAPEEPNETTNFEDILQVVLGFQSQPYSFSDPGSCP